MKLTPFAKMFIALIILSVVGYVLYTKRDSVQQWANTGQGGKPAEKPSQKTDPGGQSAVGKDDFSAIGAAREAGKSGVWRKKNSAMVASLCSLALRSVISAS